ncbi:Asp-tRNA(Asn)/Glu-tRNA(Gln) amidotransferase subunit GatC [Dolosicoccus paucivorans]
MMSRKEMSHIAAIMKLDLSDEELDQIVDRFKRIEEFAKEMETIDTSNVEGTYYGNRIINVYREDVLKPVENRDEILEHAIDTEDGFIRVPAIMEEA